MRQVNNIMVHCTGTLANASISSICDYWRRIGWKRPGYHFIIDANGFVSSLLHVEFVANGAYGWNGDTVHVAYVGGLVIDDEMKYEDTRTDAQKKALIGLLTLLRKQYPKARILGHRDIWGYNPADWQKVCPCFDASLEYAMI